MNIILVHSSLLGLVNCSQGFIFFCELLIDSRSRLKMYKAVGEELVLRRNESEFVHKWRYSASYLLSCGWQIIINHILNPFQMNPMFWIGDNNDFVLNLSKFYNTARLMLYCSNFTITSDVRMRPTLGWSKLWLDGCKSPHVPSPCRPSPRPRYSPSTTSTSTLR